MKKIRILIAEDHQLIRETLTSMLNSEDQFEVIAACGDTAKAILTAQKKIPDIILMDVNILPLNGFQATARLREILPFCKVIGLSLHTDIAVVQKMFAAGARGYLTKNSGRQELMNAIIRVHAGGIYVSNEISEKGYEFKTFSSIYDPKTSLLTNKEIQISHFIQDGLRSKEIAGKLKISVKTVSAHRHNIFKKLNVNSSLLLINLLNSRVGYAQLAMSGDVE